MIKMCLRRSVGLLDCFPGDEVDTHIYTLHMYEVDIWLGVVKIEIKSPFYQVFERKKGQKIKGGNKRKRRK